jgi:hypothetical protein
MFDQMFGQMVNILHRPCAILNTPRTLTPAYQTALPISAPGVQKWQKWQILAKLSF